MSRRAPARSAGLCPAAFSRSRAFSRGWDYVSSYDPLFSKASSCFSLVYTIGAPRGWEGTRKIFFFAYKAHHPIVGPFRSCSVLVRQIRARENFLQKMDLFFVFSKITSEIKTEKKSCLLISLKVESNFGVHFKGCRLILSRSTVWGVCYPPKSAGSCSCRVLKTYF